MVVRELSGRFSGRNLVTKWCFNGSLCLFWPLRGQKRHGEHHLVTKFRPENRPESPLTTILTLSGCLYSVDELVPEPAFMAPCNWGTLTTLAGRPSVRCKGD